MPRRLRRSIFQMCDRYATTRQRNFTRIEVLHSHRHLLLPVPLGDGQCPLEANLAVLERGGVFIESIWRSHAQVLASDDEVLPAKLLAQRCLTMPRRLRRSIFQMCDRYANSSAAFWNRNPSSDCVLARWSYRFKPQAFCTLNAPFKAKLAC